MWSVKKEAPTYLKPASRVSDDVEGFRGHNNNLHLQCGSNNLDSLDSQNSGLTQCLHHVQELGVRVMPLGTSDSPVIQPDSGCIPHPKVRCFQIAAAFFKRQGLMRSGLTSNQQSITSPFSCRGLRLLWGIHDQNWMGAECGKYLRVVGVACFLWTWV